MDIRDSQRIKEIRDNTAKIADAFNRIADELQLFREAFVANNMSICESCANNPCNKKAMLGDRRIYECTLYERAEQTEPNSSEKPNNCEHITEDGVTCAKYPACDDCLDNPLNKVKGSERLVKGSEQTEPTISKMEQVETEPQTDWHYDEQDATWYPYKHEDEPQKERSE